MNRLFGKAKPKVPAPTLDDASKSMETRGSAIDEKIKKLDDELIRYKQQLAKMKPSPSKSQLSQRALRCLQQKKMYEKQRDSLYSQSFNIDQTKFAQQNVSDTILTVNAMKDAQKSLKVDMKKVNISEVEDLHDDMNDLLEDADEINDIMGRSYGVPEELNEEDLMNELDAMESELNEEAESNEIPAYLVNAASANKNVSQNNNTVTQNNNRSNNNNDVAVDEFGLPMVPQRSLEI